MNPIRSLKEISEVLRLLAPYIANTAGAVEVNKLANDIAEYDKQADNSAIKCAEEIYDGEWRMLEDSSQGKELITAVISKHFPQPLPVRTQHSGDCTIYSAAINRNPTDGICTCGYGLSLLPDWSHMLSLERQITSAPLPVSGETPRVDALQRKYNGHTDVMEIVELYALARQIENELATALDANRRANAAIGDIANECATERAAREQAESAKEIYQCEAIAAVRRAQAAEAQSGDVAKLREACESALAWVNPGGIHRNEPLREQLIAALESVPAETKPPQVDATLEGIAQELRAFVTSEPIYPLVALSKLADAISAHARKSQPVNEEELRAVANSHANKWVEQCTVTDERRLNDLVRGYCAGFQYATHHPIRAADSASPGETMERELAEALREIKAVNESGSFAHASHAKASAYAVLGKFDARKTEGGK